jgi:dienelactone hydrolase
VYGLNTTVGGTMDTLKMDIYQPTGDVATQRPLIVMAHGGSFVGGSKKDLVALCTAFAQRGYVTASIDYRLGMGFPPDSIQAMSAVWRAVQDMKAAVRFFRKDAATANVFRVDPNMIFVGGASAGGIMAVHYAYLDKPAEISSTAIDTIALGGIEGNSGNAGYSSKVKAIVNICGAIADTSWIQAGDVAMVSAAGNNDNTVPYCTNTIYLGPYSIMVVHGSGTMVKRMNHLGIMNPIHTFYGQGHSSPGAVLNVDTTIILMSDFLYQQLGCTPPTHPVSYTNTPSCTYFGGYGVNEIILNSENVSLYPNPVSEKFALTLKNVKGNKFSAQIFDITGREVKKISFADKDVVVMRNNIQNGLYFLRITSDAGELFVTKIVFTE